MKNIKAKKSHKAHIERLEAEIKTLQTSNKMLTDENSALKIANENYKQAVDDLSERMYSIRQEYEESIKDAKEAKDEYKNLMRELSRERGKFSRDAAALLGKMKNPKRNGKDW